MGRWYADWRYSERSNADSSSIAVASLGSTKWLRTDE